MKEKLNYRRVKSDFGLPISWQNITKACSNIKPTYDFVNNNQAPEYLFPDKAEVWDAAAH
jgi:hypothetical protein